MRQVNELVLRWHLTCLNEMGFGLSLQSYAQWFSQTGVGLFSAYVETHIKLTGSFAQKACEEKRLGKVCQFGIQASAWSLASVGNVEIGGLGEKRARQKSVQKHVQETRVAMEPTHGIKNGILSVDFQRPKEHMGANLVDVGRGAKIYFVANKWGFPTKPK